MSSVCSYHLVVQTVEFQAQPLHPGNVTRVAQRSAVVAVARCIHEVAIQCPLQHLGRVREGSAAQHNQQETAYDNDLLLHE